MEIVRDGHFVQPLQNLLYETGIYDRGYKCSYKMAAFL